MIASIRELFQYQELLRRWILREIAVRYKQSVLGITWAVLQPLALMVMFTLVFSFLTRMPTDDIPYPLFSYLGLLPWTFFQTSVSFGVPSLINNLNLVTKIYFPREILPIGAVGAALLDFAIASVLFVIMLLFYRLPISWTTAWVPLLIVIQIILTIGVTLLGSAIVVLYRDVRFVVPLALQLWLYATPVIYPTSLVPEKFRPLYMLNPLAGIVDAYRQVLLYGRPPELNYLGSAAIVALALFFIGYATFKRLEVSFADII